MSWSQLYRNIADNLLNMYLRNYSHKAPIQGSKKFHVESKQGRLHGQKKGSKSFLFHYSKLSSSYCGMSGCCRVCSGRGSNLGNFGVNLGGFALHKAKPTDISDTLVLCSGPLAAVGQGGCVHPGAPLATVMTAPAASSVVVPLLPPTALLAAMPLRTMPARHAPPCLSASPLTTWR